MRYISRTNLCTTSTKVFEILLIVFNNFYLNLFYKIIKFGKFCKKIKRKFDQNFEIKYHGLILVS